MIKNLKVKFKKNLEITALAILMTITAVSTTYYNYKKSLNNKTYYNFIDNILEKKISIYKSTAYTLLLM